MPHDPNTVLCTDCKHYQGIRTGFVLPRICFHPSVRSLVDGSGSEIIGTRYLKCKGLLWEEKPVPPPIPPRKSFTERVLKKLGLK